MSLVSLVNVPRSDAEFSIFSFANQDHHRLIADSIAKTGPHLLVPVLDPIPWFDVRSWLIRHQDLHNQQNEALGIPGNDLSDVDFENEREKSAWIFLHWNEHQQAAITTGIF